MQTSLDIELASKQLAHYLTHHHAQLVTAESCTGGWLAQCITDIAGSSTWFDRGFISYSNAAKIDMLHVQQSSLTRYGAVSAEIAILMTQGALQHSLADYALAITGIAGPTGGTAKKPVGTVYIAWQKKGANAQVIRENFIGDRQQIRLQAVYSALRLIPSA